MTFEQLDLNDNILDALYDMRFDTCTPVQEHCIPKILEGRDILGVAQTGTGKTAAYLLPILSMLDDGGYPHDAINCIIMSPTRELAQQIDQAMQGFGYYLDSVSNRNAILRYNYEDLFILRTGFGITFNDGENAVRANIELAGNFLNGVSKLLNMEKNANGRYTFINIAYAQYVKFDVDFTRLFQFDQRNSLAFHVGFGVAYPYGNSTILPFEKRYFAGGANSVRGWRVRELGPGSFKGTDGRIDFINQTGDMKLDLNLEYRTFLGWKLHGAAFIDAGNIWTLRSYAEQPGGQFKFDKFYQQIAVAYGLGLRLNFDYFILRFDVGMKAINPAYETSHDHYPLVHPNFKRDFAFHFAVGLPF